MDQQPLLVICPGYCVTQGILQKTEEGRGPYNTVTSQAASFSVSQKRGVFVIQSLLVPSQKLLSWSLWSCSVAATSLLRMQDLPLTSNDLKCLYSELPWPEFWLLTHSVHHTLWSRGKFPLFRAQLSISWAWVGGKCLINRLQKTQLFQLYFQALQWSGDICMAQWLRVSGILLCTLKQLFSCIFLPFLGCIGSSASNIFWGSGEE